MRAALLGGVFALAIAACRNPSAALDAGVTVEMGSAPPTSNVALFPTTASLPVPPDWPTDVPIYSGVHIAKVGAFPKRDGGMSRTIEFDTRAALDTVIDFYRRAFPLGKKMNDIPIPMGCALQFIVGAETVDIMLMNGLGLTQVSVTVVTQ